MTPRDQWQAVRNTDVKVSLKLGPNTADRYAGDPKRLAFFLYRYAIAAKLLHDKSSILDVGCGDGFGLSTFLQDTAARGIVGMDFDESLIRYAKCELLPALHIARGADASRLSFTHGDFLETNHRNWAGIVSLDCIEHIDPNCSQEFLDKIGDALPRGGMAVVGTPNEHAAHLGSAHSRLGHINNFTPDRLREEMKHAGFSNVILMGLNDCTINMGHPSLWHYILGVGTK